MSLQFLEVEIGGPAAMFLESGNAVTVPFTFPYPAVGAVALLQGFELEFTVPDNELDSIAIVPSVHFGAGDRSGTVEVRFSMVGDSFVWPPWEYSADTITGHIRLLVIGTDKPLSAGEPIIPHGKIPDRPTRPSPRQEPPGPPRHG